MYRLMENLSPLPLSGERLKFYVERDVDRKFLEFAMNPRTFSFVEADSGFGKTSSVNYWSFRLLPRLGIRAIKLRARAALDILYQPAVRILDELSSDIAFSASMEPSKISLVDRLTKMHDRISSASSLADQANFLLRLDEIASEEGRKFIVLVDDFKTKGVSSLSSLIRELDSLAQEPRSIFFVLMGTPSDLMVIMRAYKPLYEKLEVLKMPHFSFEEAKEALRLRVEDAGYVLDEVFPENVLSAIHALSTGPRELFTIARDYVKLGDLREAVRRAEERATISMIELLEPGEREILEFVASRGRATASEILSSFRIPRSTMYVRIQRLQQKGLLAKKGRGVYSLTKEAEKAMEGIRLP